MGETVLLLVPEASVPRPVTVSSSREITGGGLCLGTLDNGKGNTDHLLRFEAKGGCAPRCPSHPSPRCARRIPRTLLRRT